MGETYQLNQKSITQPSLKKLFLRKPTPKDFRNSSTYNKGISRKQNNLLTPIEGISALSFKEEIFAGSMTVEAAIVLPFFLFFFLNFLWIIEIYNLQGTLQMALRECGRELSTYAYAYDRIVQEEDDEGLEALLENVAFSYLYVKGRVEEEAGEEYLENAPIYGGRTGLIYADSSILQQGDIIDLVISYRAVPFVDVVGFSPGWFYARYYGRAWTGYDVSGEDSAAGEGYVYIAENASVYHLSRECSHISLTIRECSLQETGRLRNEYGERYTACERCVMGGESMVFITADGNRYHRDRECGGLRRTVQRVPVSQAQALYEACLRCGQ